MTLSSRLFVFVAVASALLLFSSFFSAGSNSLAHENTSFSSQYVKNFSDFYSGAKPNYPFYDPLNNYIYIPHFSTNNVTVISANNNSFVTSVNVGSGPEEIALDYKTGELYVSNYNGHNLTIINGRDNSVSGSVNVGSNPFGITYDFSNGMIYVSNRCSNNVSVINGSDNQVAQSINVGSEPMAETFAFPSNYVYVVNTASRNVSIIDTANEKVVASVNVGSFIPGYGFEISYDYFNQYVYVPNTCSNNVTVINSMNNNVVATIPVGTTPEGSAYDPSTTYIYIVNSASDTVSEINGSTNRVVANISSANDPNSATYDPSNGFIYIGEWNTGDIQEIPYAGSSQVTFNEIGLPEHSLWFANITGHLNGPIASPSYSIFLKNGTYLYTIATSNKTFKPTPQSGHFEVKGAPVSQLVLFTMLYSVTFTESGLPSGTAWYVNFSNAMESGPITGTSYSFSLTNGTYLYTIATSNKTFKPTPQSGHFEVKGAPVSQLVLFTMLYSVTFTESGLPSGTAWYVNFSNAMESGPITGTSYSFSLTNGTYSYTVSKVSGLSVSPSSGSITVNGSSISIAVTFSPVKKVSPLSSISSIELYGIIGAVVAVAVIGAGYALIRKRK